MFLTWRKISFHFFIPNFLLMYIFIMKKKSTLKYFSLIQPATLKTGIFSKDIGSTVCINLKHETI
jgi:hypothetical protein